MRWNGLLTRYSRYVRVTRPRLPKYPHSSKLFYSLFGKKLNKDGIPRTIHAAQRTDLAVCRIFYRCLSRVSLLAKDLCGRRLNACPAADTTFKEKPAAFQRTTEMGSTYFSGFNKKKKPAAPTVIKIAQTRKLS